MLKDMSDPVQGKKRATYQDILDAPPDKVAEIVNGDLHLWPRPHSPHTAVQSSIIRGLGPYDPGDGGPGGWTILFEPELHLDEDVLVPDVAGWRSHRLPVVPDGYVSIVPDWICEVLSPSTERIDRMEKMPIYAAAGVHFAWLVSARERTLEAYRRVDERWVTLGVFRDVEQPRVEPFDATEFRLASLWAKIPLPNRAQEEPAQYDR
jgi:Uma2 family endonuclease